MAPDSGGPSKYRSHRRGVKVWFNQEKPTRFHYEAQLIPPRLAGEMADGEFAIEIGFHAEHGDEQRNRTVLDRLGAKESTWRKPLGPEAELGAFLGNDRWGRLSEVWIESDLSDPELAFELASRLVDYIDVIEPLLGEHD